MFEGKWWVNFHQNERKRIERKNLLISEIYLGHLFTIFSSLKHDWSWNLLKVYSWDIDTSTSRVYTCSSTHVKGTAIISLWSLKLWRQLQW